MSVGVKDISRLRLFAANLNQAGNDLSSTIQTLNAQLSFVLDIWDDTKARSFASDFEPRRAQVVRLALEMQEFSSYINRYCEKLEEAQNIR